MGFSVIDRASEFYPFLSGAAMFAAWVAGVIFFRFWSRSRDRLFFMFGAAFWLMAIERLVLMFLHDPGNEDHSHIYLIRLASFLLIVFAIVDKNRKENKGAA